MFADKALEEIEQWRRQATAPEHQLDWRWVERYRQLDAYDAYWWWAQAGPFNQEEQRQWAQLYSPNVAETTKEQLGTLLAQSRQRELLTASAEQRQPRLHYPALDIEEVRYRVAGLRQLYAEISQHEPNAIVRRLYHGAIEEEVDFMSMIEATYEGNTQRYWELSRHIEPEPTFEEMEEALSHVKRTLQQGLRHAQTREVSQQLIQFVQEQLYLSFETSSENAEGQEVPPDNLASSSRTITAQAAKRFFEAALQTCGYEGWQVIIDPKASGPRVEGAARQLFIEDDSLSVDEIRHYFAHELAGHVARGVAGQRSRLGLLGMGTRGYMATEEGIALYQEGVAASQQVRHDWGTWLGTLATGLASGVVTPPQTFLSLCTFFELLFLLRRLLLEPNQDKQLAQKRARNVAFSRCLRTYRGVPDLEKAGVCFTKDVVYLRGLQIIERAVAADETMLDRLAVGKVGIQDLPDLQALGILSSPQPLRTLAYDPALEAHILSFEEKLEEYPTQST